MIYKLESVRVVIGKIVRDLGLGDMEVNYQDMIEWIAEGLQDIGAYYQFTHKPGTLEVEDFKAELPCDFYEMVRIMDTTVGNRIDHNSYLIGDSQDTINSTVNNSSEHKINHNIMTVGFRTGTVDIQYLAFPVDTEGFPLVPDNEEYRKALFWKVAYQLGIQGFEFKNKQLGNIEFTGKKWGRLKLSARAEANMPDPHLKERLKNNWLRLVNHSNEYDTKFINIDKPQSLNLDGSN